MKKGFTLIELLVVVLIIGILSSIALPKYNKAVKRARGREVLVAIKALDEALPVYALANGNMPNTAIQADQLSIALPTLTHFSYVFNTLSPTFSGIKAGRIVAFQKDRNTANVKVYYDEKGKRLKAVCTKADCPAYFECNSQPAMETRCLEFAPHSSTQCIRTQQFPSGETECIW